MKKGKKILSVVMAVCIMAASVMGCSGKTPADEQTPADAKTQDETPAEITTEETTQETAQDTTAGTDSYKVGLEIWSTDDALGGHTKQIIEEFGKLWNMELIVHTSDYASEAQIKSIEDFIAAEVDGIIAVPCDEDTTVLMAEKCQEAGIPLVLAYRNVVDEGNIAKLEGNTSFIAEIENGDYMMGYNMVQQIIDDGYTKIALIDTPKGNANDIRENGMRDAMADNNLEFVAVSTLSDSYEAIEGTNLTENILNVYPDTEIIVLSCGSNGIVDAALAKVATMGMSETCSIATVDAPDAAEDYINAGTLYCVGGLIYNSAYYGAVILANYLQGNPLAEGRVAYPQVQPIIYGAEDAGLNQKYMIDALPYTQEEMKNMLVSVNPDFTFEQLMEEGNTFSLADLANK
ncbi:MAG: sugar ABC transporter substrate-binding protein [Lachnospiraceae bacterium]|jgi:ABC-type sugar transport system substrate-binding protein|nr:hypothetical protein C819_03338 [Lachnospiraceae bacterium 10-1]MCX4351341.1 sugar ABC transporter substrate-binding protein [Lachnospiraceae bacterium]